MPDAKRSKTEKRVREVADMALFASRVIKAIGRRAEDGDPEALSQLDILRREIAEVMSDAVGTLRSRPWSYSWSDIGQALGVTRQAAQQRFGG